MDGLPRIFLDVLGPVVILIAIGFGVGRWLKLDPAPFAKLAFWVIGPAFIFDSLANAGLAADALVRVAAASTIAFAASAVFAAIISARLTKQRRAAIITTGAYGNAGNFGLAIVVFTFGESSLPFAAIGLVVVNTLGLIVGIAGAHGGWRGLGVALTRPMTLVIVPALIVNATESNLPLVINRPIGMLAGAIIPLMLITLGIQLQQMSKPSIDGDVFRSLLTKLLVQPLVAIPVVALLDLSDVASGAVILQAAMPAAVFTTVLAIEQNTRPNQTAMIVLAGTIASLATLPWFILYVS